MGGMSASLSADDRRLLLIRLIATALDEYESGQIGLARLVSDVEHCVDGLFDVADDEWDDEWVEEWRSAWGRFEIPYAVALAEERTVLDEGDHREIATGVEELRTLIAAGPRLPATMTRPNDEGR
jgi:hypothetical protein